MQSYSVEREQEAAWKAKLSRREVITAIFFSHCCLNVETSNNQCALLLLACCTCR
jgi:hypothetical protein